MAIKKRKISPRQKMINLMYVVLMAMLALNISTEVLNGFSVVEESLNRLQQGNSSKENELSWRTRPNDAQEPTEGKTVVCDGIDGQRDE